MQATNPSRAKPFSVNVSMRWEMPYTLRFSSLKRCGPPLRLDTMSMLHVSPTLFRKSRAARQWTDPSSPMCLGDIGVLSCVPRRLGYQTLADSE